MCPKRADKPQGSRSSRGGRTAGSTSTTSQLGSGDASAVKAVRVTFDHENPDAATEATLHFSGKLLSDLLTAEKSFWPEIVRNLTTDKIFIITDDTQQYFTETHSQHVRLQSKVDGDAWAFEGYTYYARVRLSVYDAHDGQTPLIDEGKTFATTATSFPYGVVVLPDGRTISQRAHAEPQSSTLLKGEITVPLTGEDAYIDIPLSELNDEVGLRCSWYRKTEDVGLKAYDEDKLPSLKYRQKKTAILKGSVNIALQRTHATASAGATTSQTLPTSGV